MTELAIPAGPDEVTSEWLTQSLRSAGMIARARIESFGWERIGQGQGFVGQLSRLRLEYETVEEGAPSSIVGKFSSAEPDIRMLTFPLNEREVRFYQEIAPKSELRTPSFYYGALDPDTGKSVLLLKDIVDARVGDNLAGCSVEQAELAIRHLAKFHATWWESSRLDEFPWLSNINDNAAIQQESYPQRWDRFTEKVGDQISAPFRKVAVHYGKHIVRIRGQAAERPTTMIHGDYRLDNLLFGLPGSDTSLVAIDWQLVGRGPGAQDVAYFLAFGLEPELRRAAEMGLLKGYHETLVENGVSGYGFDECQEDYRLAMFRPLHTLVNAGAILDFTSERGSALVSALVRRTSAAMADHRMGELLPDGRSYVKLIAGRCLAQ